MGMILGAPISKVSVQELWCIPEPLGNSYVLTLGPMHVLHPLG